MRFMLLQNYAPTEVAHEFIGAWAPEDAQANIEFQRRMSKRLALGDTTATKDLTSALRVGIVWRQGCRSRGATITLVGLRSEQHRGRIAAATIRGAPDARA
jgi:hypothetical protein